MAKKLGARKDSKWIIVSTSPDVCKTPPLNIPVPYQVTSDLGDAQGTIDTVRLNNNPAFVFDKSKAPKTRGDEAGTGGGIKSGTVGADCWPKEKSDTVSINKKKTIREGDKFHMNGSFNGG
ncbi:DUF4150 domain-containing protein [Morganella psychrotolerans]|uniref:Uncharacterized protein n=1 Tax=Morganella psychrotolerans TaxID=368603 RepID=A0A1B8HAC8_9GAMM|nr:DUF4150 domain-containing protein [Morganella psychrotolerans]OBU06035.1 hypothetical protein AYY17_06860 [Morganella psychrotolerans]